MKTYFVPIFVVGLITVSLAQADTIAVENYSFEQPGTGKIQTDWGLVPGWSSDVLPADSGVESDWPGSTDGVWSGFLMAADPSIWQLTDYTIATGDILSLLVDCRNNWSSLGSSSLEMSLYYDDTGARVQLATTTVALTDTWTEFSLVALTDPAPDSVGKRVGIELNNPSAGDSWIGLDNVRLTVVPEPATVTLLLLSGGALLLWRRRHSR